MEINKETGALYREPVATDFKAGGETGIESVARNRKKNWVDSLPDPEKQKGKFIDSMACVTYSALNSLEAQFPIVKDKLTAKQIKDLLDMGYIVNGQLSLSDRFTAKMSGTTKQGAYMTAVWDSIRNHGVLPESDWPSDPSNFTWEEYYKDIPQKLKDKAKKFKDIFDVKYEWVPVTKKNKKMAVRDFLQTAPIQILVKVASNWAEDIVVLPPTEKQKTYNHAVLLYGFGNAIEVYDHYLEYKKKLAVEYPILSAIRGVLSVREEEKNYRTFYHFTEDIAYGQRSKSVELLQRCMLELGYMKKSVLPTGYYGDITADAVYRFQVEHNISNLEELNRLRGRVVGVKTRARLNSMFAE